MKRTLWALVFAFSVASFVYAQDQPPAQTKEMPGMAAKAESPLKSCGGMMGDKMDKGMKMHGAMMPMMPKQLVASNDGGVIVLAGNKLYKYDKNLTLVKEAEVKVDMEGMKKMMEGMKANCPMMKHDEKGEAPGEMDMADMPEPGK
jgi:hypothetical protein